MSPDCGHAAPAVGKVCHHLLASHEDTDYIARYFTGQGREYHYVCRQCTRQPEELLKTVCRACFAALDEERWDIFIVGRPQILERVTHLTFSPETVHAPDISGRNMLDIQPVEQANASAWIVLFEDGEIARLDLDRHMLTSIFRLQPSDLRLSDQSSITFSPDTRWLAITNTYKSDGVVVDASTGRVTMRLDRGDYYPEQTPFPVAFFQREGTAYVVHGTSWNRLDISDPTTGKLYTERTLTACQRGKPCPEHYLDYFHGKLLVSPDHEWVAEYGWVWPPIGEVRSWSVKRWIQENVWESEDGASIRELAWSLYFWNGPMCWLGSRTLAVWGFGTDEENLIPAVRIWDVVSGDELGWFLGPENGLLVFDHYLFSASEQGTDVWDVNTGERLLHDPGLNPRAYHCGVKQFLSILPDGTFQLSRLRGVERK